MMHLFVHALVLLSTSEVAVGKAALCSFISIAIIRRWTYANALPRCYKVMDADLRNPASWRRRL
jgi:hypothetical protein